MKEGSKDLEIAAKVGLTEIVQALLATGHRDESGCALYWAAGNGHLEIVKLLLTSGYRHVTAARAAVLGGHTLVALTILNIDDSDRDLLWYSAESGNLEVVRALLEKGHRDKDALRAAVRGGYLEIFKALLNTNHWCDGIFDLAVYYGNLEIVELLLARGCWSKNAIYSATLECHMGVLKVLLEAGHRERIHESLALTLRCGQKDFVEILETYLARDDAETDIWPEVEDLNWMDGGW